MPNQQSTKSEQEFSIGRVVAAIVVGMLLLLVVGFVFRLFTSLFPGGTSTTLLGSYSCGDFDLQLLHYPSTPNEGGVDTSYYEIDFVQGSITEAINPSGEVIQPQRGMTKVLISTSLFSTEESNAIISCLSQNKTDIDSKIGTSVNLPA